MIPNADGGQGSNLPRVECQFDRLDAAAIELAEANQGAVAACGTDDAQPQPDSVPDILIVDDTPENLKLLAALLASESYHIRKALNGSMALKAVAADPPDLILLDIMMPDMDGYTVCETLKADPVTAGIPVLFLSGLSDAFDKVRAFEVGAAD
jgi:PleD family two-component response regulator